MPTDPPAPRGIPIDETGPPAWVLDYFSPAQVKELSPALLWMLLIYKSRGLGSPAVSLAQRIYIAVHTMKKTETKRTWLSVRTLSVDLDMASTNTVMSGLKVLEEAGWIVTRPRPNTVRSKEYLPCWPVRDCIADNDGPERCGAPTKKGVCTRRAGWGTVTPGEGPCKRHGGTPKNPGKAPEPEEETGGGAAGEDARVSQEMTHQDPPEPVDNPGEEGPEPAEGVASGETRGVSPHEAVSQEVRHGVAGDETDCIRVRSLEFDQHGVTQLPSAQPEVEGSPAGRAKPSAKRDHLRVVPPPGHCFDCGTVLDPDGSCFACPSRSQTGQPSQLGSLTYRSNP